MSVVGVDLLLQKIYRDQSKLLVVFLSADYDRKEWPFIEFKAIRSIMMKRDQEHRVMYIRMDDAEIEGVQKLDGYIDARKTGHGGSFMLWIYRAVVHSLL